MRILMILTISTLPMLAGCQTKGEKKAPCPPISSYSSADDLCGPIRPVNDAFSSVLQG